MSFLVAEFWILVLKIIFFRISFGKTISAIFPEIDILNRISENGGEIKASAQLKKTNISFVDRISKNGHITIDFAVGSGSENITAKFLTDGQKAAISSTELLGEDKYTIEFEDISEKLDNSVFSPEKNTIYSLDKKTFDQLKTFAESLKKNYDTDLESSLKNMINAVMETAVMSKNKENIEIRDEKIYAEIYSFNFNENAFSAFADAFERDAQNDIFKNFIENSFHPNKLRLCLIHSVNSKKNTVNLTSQGGNQIRISDCTLY